MRILRAFLNANKSWEQRRINKYRATAATTRRNKKRTRLEFFVVWLAGWLAYFGCGIQPSFNQNHVRKKTLIGFCYFVLMDKQVLHLHLHFNTEVNQWSNYNSISVLLFYRTSFKSIEIFSVFVGYVFPKPERQFVRCWCCFFDFVLFCYVLFATRVNRIWKWQTIFKWLNVNVNVNVFVVSALSVECLSIWNENRPNPFYRWCELCHFDNSFSLYGF